MPGTFVPGTYACRLYKSLRNGGNLRRKGTSTFEGSLISLSYPLETHKSKTTHQKRVCDVTLSTLPLTASKLTNLLYHETRINANFCSGTWNCTRGLKVMSLARYCFSTPLRNDGTLKKIPTQAKCAFRFYIYLKSLKTLSYKRITRSASRCVNMNASP